MAHALRRRSASTEDGGPDTWVEVVGMPLVLLLVALWGDELWRERAAAGVAAAWIAVTAVFLRLDGAAHRARHLSVILVAVLIWVAAPRGLVIYLANFDTYNRGYGSIGAVAALLIWLYLSGYAILLGAAVDASRARRRAEGLLQ